MNCYCGQCNHFYDDPENYEWIELFGMCLGCDHLLGDVLEAHAGEPMFI